MSLRMLFGETTIVIPLDISAHLLAVGIASTDITEAIFLLKADRTLADDADGVYSALLGTDYLTQAGSVFSAIVSDFTGLLVDTKYYLHLGFKIAGDTLYREVKFTPDTSTIYFDQDGIRA